MIMPPVSHLLLAAAAGALIGWLCEALTCRNKWLGRAALLLLAGGSLLVACYFFTLFELFYCAIFAVLGYTALPGSALERKKYAELSARLAAPSVEELKLRRDWRRLAADYLIALAVSGGMILLVALLPAEHHILPFVALVYLVNLAGNLLNRTVRFFTLRIAYDHAAHHLYIVTPVAPRDIPLADIQGLRKESAPDLLKLHPLFLAISSHEDLTVNFAEVLVITLPGESLYLTVAESSHWQEILAASRQQAEQPVEMRTVLPLFHPRNLQRLLAKGYYAVTVKGISAYSALVLLLYYLEVPQWLLAPVVLLWWLINLYLADRLIVSILDLKPIAPESETYRIAQPILQQIGLPQVRLYETETQLHNAFATGMNTGRGIIALTSSVLKLPLPVIEGIIAHEAVHVKKRDVLLNQLYRVLLLLLLVALIWPLQGVLTTIAREHAWMLYVGVPLLMLLSSSLFSLLSQIMEVRADQLGATLLPRGAQQMAEALEQLALAEAAGHAQTLQHQLPAEEQEQEEPSPDLPHQRGTWFWRVLEFHFQAYPPLYWRIASLRENSRGWGWFLIKRLFVDRLRESLPDRIVLR